MSGSNGNGVRRVVVTGMGAVSALGNDVASTWAGLLAGRSGVRTIERFDPSRVDSKIAAEVRDFDPSGVIDRKEMRRMDRYIQFGLVVARQALDQAGLPGRMDGALAQRTGCILGSGLGGVATLFDNVLLMAERGPDRISPFFIPMGIANVGSGQIAIAFGMLGPNFATVSACATGAHAIGESWETIRRGDADIMLAGGTEAAIHEAVLGGFSSMKALSTRNDDPEGASRPFDKGRDGFVMGEGAGMLVLEELSHAEARGAEPLAELVGYGATADASHITLPAPGGAGAVRAGRRALEKAGMQPEELDHVNAHATSTPEGDSAELQGLATLLGEHGPSVSITANKSMLGHTLGAAGAIESIATIQALREGAIPPTINLVDTDPYTDGLDLTPLEPTHRTINAALNNSFGFGGQNAALIFPAVERMTKPDESLLALIDQLALLLDRTELTELEVQHGSTGLVLRKPSALAPTMPATVAVAGVATAAAPHATAAPAADAGPPARPAVMAPLSGIWYGAPAPGSAPYVSVGGEVAVGQVIGLIEAMKLFNEIKSDKAGRVVKVNAEDGKLVRAKQPLIEVDPL